MLLLAANTSPCLHPYAHRCAAASTTAATGPLTPLPLFSPRSLCRPPPQVLGWLQMSTIAVMAVGARLPQIWLNWRRGNAGVLSVVTCCLNVAGCVVRIFTTLVLTVRRMGTRRRREGGEGEGFKPGQSFACERCTRERVVLQPVACLVGSGVGVTRSATAPGVINGQCFGVPVPKLLIVPAPNRNTYLTEPPSNRAQPPHPTPQGDVIILGGCITQLVLNAVLLWQCVATPGHVVAVASSSAAVREDGGGGGSGAVAAPLLPRPA